MPFYMTPTDETQSPASIRAPCPIFSPCPCSQRRARYPAAPVHNKFVRRGHTVGCDHVVLPMGRDSWGTIVVLCDGFYAKAWSVIRSPRPESTRTARPVGESYMRPSCRIWASNRERATRRSRLVRHLPQSHRCIHGAGRWPRRALGFVFLLASDGRACIAEMEGRRTGATLSAPGSRAYAPTSSILGNVPSPTQDEVLQNFYSKSRLNPKQ